MNLSRHFTLEEMTRTQVRSLAEQNRWEAVEFIPDLKRVCDELLEPVRALFNKPIHIHSGYRCASLNSLIGGSPTSQHLIGQAVDFDIDGKKEYQDLHDALYVIMESGIRFNQLLIENGCLHIALPHENTIQGEVAFWSVGVKTIIRARLLS